MNRLPLRKQELLISAFVEGNSVRGSARIADVTLNTALRNLVWLGTASQKFHDEHVQNLQCKSIECDELWSFIYAKGKNLPPALKNSNEAGDMYTWISMCSDSKLAVSWHVGKRIASDAGKFMTDVAQRIPGQVQITTDGFPAYATAIEESFGTRADHATLVKILDQPPLTPDKRREQPKLTGAQPTVVMGNPDPERVSTSTIERQNLTLRMSLRRYARATNAFSRKIENKRAALSLHFLYYNFMRIHLTHRVTPAMEAGVSDHVWSYAEIAGLCA